MITISTLPLQSILNEIPSLLTEIKYEEFNTLDSCIMIIILLSTFLGIYRGFFASLLSLSGWILSFWLTQNIYYTIQPMLNKYMSTFVSMILGYSIIFLLLLLFFGIVNFILNTMLKPLFSGSFINRIFGGAFGFFRGILLVSILFFCLNVITHIFVDIKNDNEDTDHGSFSGMILNSQSHKVLELLNQVILNILPSNLAEKISLPNHKVITASNITSENKNIENNQKKDKNKPYNNFNFPNKNDIDSSDNNNDINTEKNTHQIPRTINKETFSENNSEENDTNNSEDFLQNKALKDFLNQR